MVVAVFVAKLAGAWVVRMKSAFVEVARRGERQRAGGAGVMMDLVT
jgi:hypothetical protein